LSEGYPGIGEVLKITTKMQFGCLEFSECLKIYNLLLYISPLAILSTYCGDNWVVVSPALLQLIPYEICAQTLDALMVETNVQDINWTLRLQFRAESALLPPLDFFRDSYNITTNGQNI
jgi:hypothetical protein